MSGTNRKVGNSKRKPRKGRKKRSQRTSPDDGDDVTSLQTMTNQTQAHPTMATKTATVTVMETILTTAMIPHQARSPVNHPILGDPIAIRKGASDVHPMQRTPPLQ